MTDIFLNPKESSVFSRYNNQSSHHSRCNVPHNSPCLPHNTNTGDKYRIINGEQKNCKHRPGLHLRHLKSSDFQSGSDDINNLDSHHVPAPLEESTQTKMFHDQKQLLKRNECEDREKCSIPLDVKSELTIKSKHSIAKCDTETNTEPEDNVKQPSKWKVSPNSCLINIKSSDPQPESPSVVTLHKQLNLQKMPSVNIRPEFTIHKGPKININASTTNVHHPRRRNNELFDIVHPLCNSLYNDFAESSEHENNLYKNSCVEYVCERHTFPSGRLIPDRTCGDYSIDFKGKKDILIKLIKSVSEKINKQSNKSGDCSCRLLHSLPLLASVVSKVHVQCVMCVNTLNRHLDRLISLMKEELRNPRDLSYNRCCQFDEVVHYQIVELELIQNVSCKESQSSGEVKFTKHQDTVHPTTTSLSLKSTTSKAGKTSVDSKCNLVSENYVNGKKPQRKNINTICITDQQLLTNRQSCAKDDPIVRKQNEDENTTTDIDGWIKEHNDKIKQIHGELYTIITTSVENELELQPSIGDSFKSNEEKNRIQEPFEQKGLVDQSRSEIQREENDITELKKPECELKTLLNVNEEQDDCVDYSDDFEEIDDVSEGSVQTSTKDSHHENLADAESKCSSISIISDIITNKKEEKQEEPPVKAYGNIVLPGNQMPPDINAEGDEYSPSLNVAKLLETDVVNAGTSPINQTCSQNVSSSLEMISTHKKNTATSPIINEMSYSTEYKSANTQTSPELLPKLIKDCSLGKHSNKEDMSLIAPCDKLNPTPVEHIFDSLKNKNYGKNAPVLENFSTNQMTKLIVQLPELSIYLNRNQQIERIENEVASKPSVSNLNEQSSQTDLKYSNTALEELNSVINQHDKQLLNSHSTKGIVKPSTVGLVTSDLLKPDIILKTGLGLWKKCDEKPIFIDIDGEKLTNDSAIQTETEKQNMSVQTTVNRNVIQIDKAVSPQNSKESNNVQEESYLNICQLPKCLPENTSYTSSPTSDSSSRSSSHSSATFRHLQREVLSEGEVMASDHVVQEIWNQCVPMLDLSFGELKTKQKNKIIQTALVAVSDTDSFIDLQSDSIDIPIHLSPSPAFFMVPAAQGDCRNEIASTSKHQYTNCQKSSSNGSLFLEKYAKQHFGGQFSEIAKQVKEELNNEKSIPHAKFKGGKSGFFDLKMHRPLTISHPGSFSSSDSIKSSSSSNDAHIKNKLHGYKKKSKRPLMITSPLGLGTSDMVVEDNDPDTSYQTSLTSVSVDNLIGTLDIMDQSSGEL